MPHYDSWYLSKLEVAPLVQTRASSSWNQALDIVSQPAEREDDKLANRWFLSRPDVGGAAISPIS